MNLSEYVLVDPKKRRWQYVSESDVFVYWKHRSCKRFLPVLLTTVQDMLLLPRPKAYFRFRRGRAGWYSLEKTGMR